MGHAKMRTPPSLINQKQTLFQKPDPRKTRSKLKNTPRVTEAYQLAETRGRVWASDTVAKGQFLKPMFIVETSPGRWWRRPLIPALGRQRQADLCELETSLVYKS